MLRISKKNVGSFHHIFTEKRGLDNAYIDRDNAIIRLGRMWGVCNICSQEGSFEIEHANLRETVRCLHCASFNRQRQLVYILSLELLHRATSLRQATKKIKKSKVLSLEANGSLHLMLSHFAEKGGVDLTSTEFIDGRRPSGSVISGIVHLDIQDTRFPNNTFDVILHSEVFEHVPDAVKAEKELARILKPGGICIFTVPFLEDADSDEVKAVVKKGEIIYHGEAVYHQDPISALKPYGSGSGSLVYRLFSFGDMRKRYAANGMRLVGHYIRDEPAGIIGNNAFIFVARKRA